MKNLRCKVTKMIKSEEPQAHTKLDDVVVYEEFEGKDFADSMESLWKLDLED